MRQVRSSDGGQPSLFGPQNAFGLAVDRTGTTYIADPDQSQIWRIDSAGTISVFAGTGEPGYADGPSVTAQFNAPLDIAPDGAGAFYVADFGNSRIRRISTDGTVSTFAGSGQQGHADGPAAAAQFEGPQALAVDGNGNVYVAELQGNRIRRITPDGTVSTLAGSGTAGYRDGPGAQAQFRVPEALAVDAAGRVYVADGGNNRIRVIAPDGTVSTLAGSGNAGLADGPASTAEFRHPSGIAVNEAGIVYVGDWLNGRICELRPDGNVYTLAGSIASAGTADGPALDAIIMPARIALDEAGDIYFWDSFLLKVLLPH